MTCRADSLEAPVHFRLVQRAQIAGRMALAHVKLPSTVGGAGDRESHIAIPIRNQGEEAHCSTNKLQASAKN